MDRATESSRKQHVVLRRLADELAAQVEGTSTLDARAIQKTLSRLAGALKLHVAMEVEGLYPELLEHPDAEVRNLAAKMIEQLKGAYEAFLKFRLAWPAEAVRGDWQGFVRQARSMIAALHRSTEHEEAALYNKVDMIYAAMKSSSIG